MVLLFPKGGLIREAGGANVPPRPICLTVPGGDSIREKIGRTGLCQPDWQRWGVGKNSSIKKTNGAQVLILIKSSK